MSVCVCVLVKSVRNKFACKKSVWLKGFKGCVSVYVLVKSVCACVLVKSVCVCVCVGEKCVCVLVKSVCVC